MITISKLGFAVIWVIMAAVSFVAGWYARKEEGTAISKLNAEKAAIQTEIQNLEDDVHNKVDGAEQKLFAKRQQLQTIMDLIKKWTAKL